jgi:hypothetical protein
MVSFKGDVLRSRCTQILSRQFPSITLTPKPKTAGALRHQAVLSVISVFQANPYPTPSGHRKTEP